MAKRPNQKLPTKTPDSEGRSVETRLALDRFVMGIWSERDLRAAGVPALEPLLSSPEPQRQREATRLRAQLFGRERPDDVEQLEALVRQGVDCVRDGMPVLPGLQHDLFAHADAVPREDPRAEAVRVLSDYACASQVNVAVQTVGRLAEATRDRVATARAEALGKLSRLLAPLPHLLPR